MRRFLLIVAACLVAALPAAAGAETLLLLPQVEYLEDSDGETLVDPSIFVSWKNLAGQVWYGEFTKGAQLGGFVRDKRRSTYGGWYRFRDDFDHVVELNTEQIVGRGFVAAAAVRLIRVIPADAPDRSLFEPRVGFDKYYRSWSFFSFRAIRDARFSDEWSFVVSNRFALEDRWITVGVVPRSDGETGWFVQGKWKRLRAGYGNYNRFDYSGIDRKIFTLGVEFSSSPRAAVQ